MRKKQLEKTNEELYMRNQELYRTIEELKKEIETLKKEVDSVTNERDKLQSKLNATKPLKALEEKVVARANVSKETEYGAQVIGKIVVSAAKYCNLLSAMPENSMKKEQVNLILGRTEVAKGDILKAISSDGSLEEKKQIIDKLEKEAYEYFNSMMAQNI